MKTNGKTLYVLLSANTGLYGSILRKTYELFKQYVFKEDGDILVIGKLGRGLLEKEHLRKKIVYEDIEDSNKNDETLKNLVTLIIQYERVIVFHGKFQTTVTQLPTATSVSGDPLPGEAKLPEIKFLFEPSLEEIMQFFEREIFTSYFEQTIHESQLAKQASRMISLDNSLENIKRHLKKLAIDEQRLKHIDFNKRQLETVSSIKLWKR